MSQAPEGRRFSILIVDDHPIVREGLRLRISSQSDMQVCGEAGTVEEALQCVQQLSPDLVTVDITLGTGSGLDLIQRLRTDGYAGRILVLSAHDDALYAERALKAGAHGYIGKSEAQSRVLIALRLVLDGGRYLSPEMNRRLVGRALGASSRDASPVDVLSNRELQVFGLIGRGLNGKAIAAELQLSAHTVDSHRERIKSKLGLSNALELQTAAVRWALAADPKP